ncbi:MAG: hypothetical protein CML99_03965 [Rhodobiaceae bacterium]|nr:hypothetical protein [Rhodobiaceae bacterium]|tara:strand:- start:188 stop:601 length:414 start_codon:yes stop_codon:yes gene_type:complete
MPIPIETINWLAVLGAFIANMAVGAVWYSPLLMGNRWLHSTGRTHDDIQDDSQSAIALVMIPAAANAIALAILTAGLGITSTYGGIALAMLIWLCFVVPTNFIEVIFDRKTVETALINNGNFLISFVIMGAIIGTWG